ncbi:alpha/beta fold hydrolase [Nocardiopsis alba]|uniref:alpha/beta fold hydrolase n=1 Tax=Nocardiopsis alba TaxID=53437 RepID=UPI00366E962A
MPPKHPAVRGTAAVLASGLALTLIAASPATADTPLPEPALFHEQEIDWTPCEEEILSSLECARVEVPLDYSDLDGERIELGVLRIPATDPEAARGALFLNFGGPGGPARLSATGYAGTELNEVYDIIGMDPRGVGASTPLDCGVDFPMMGPRPTDAEVSAHTRETIRYSRACDAAQGELRRHMTTANTARDMDVVRAVLGEERLNYLGYSYGTYLGAVYGSLFPERLDRSVLDSAIDPDEIWRATFMNQAPGYTEGVERYAEWIAEQNDEYGLGSTTTEVMDTFHTTSARLTEEPRTDVPGMGGEAYDGAFFDASAGEYARYQESWAETAPFLAALALEEKEVPPPPLQRELPDIDPTLYASNMDLFSALVCEAEWPRRISTYRQDVREHRELYPFGVGAFFAAVQSCTFTEYRPTEAPVEVTRDGYEPGVIIGGEFDPQTPLAGSVSLAERLDGPLITVTDDGAHGFYLPGVGAQDPYPCVREKVDSYLIDGDLPDDTTCPGRPRPTSVTDVPDEAPIAPLWEPGRPLPQAGPVPTAPIG